MDCTGIEPGFPSVVTFTSVMQLGCVLCLFVASYGIFSFLCAVFIYVTFVTCHREARLEMLDENAEPFVSHKRKDHVHLRGNSLARANAQAARDI